VTGSDITSHEINFPGSNSYCIENMEFIDQMSDC
jgi:hypothetical protein